MVFSDATRILDRGNMGGRDEDLEAGEGVKLSNDKDTNPNFSVRWIDGTRNPL